MRVICEINTYQDYIDSVKPCNIIRLSSGRNDGIVNIEYKDMYISIDANEFISALERCRVYNK